MFWASKAIRKRKVMAGETQHIQGRWVHWQIRWMQIILKQLKDNNEVMRTFSVRPPVLWSSDPTHTHICSWGTKKRWKALDAAAPTLRRPAGGISFSNGQFQREFFLQSSDGLTEIVTCICRINILMLISRCCSQTCFYCAIISRPLELHSHITARYYFAYNTLC